MNFHTERVRVAPGKAPKLSQRDTRIDPLYESEAHYEALLKAQVERLSALQDILYAYNRESLLIIFQGMDASGKDGAIKHVMSGLNPQGCVVRSFKQPTPEELDHDFLWRTTRLLPERGMIGIFNRSYYEEVLVVKVHPAILQRQNLPGWSEKPKKSELKELFEDRYASIRHFEKHLARNGTRVIKFFLHLGKDEQKRRFLERIDTPSKNWKFSADDVRERGFFGDYMKAYETCIHETGSDHAPWHVIPADDKKNARLLMAQVIVETLGGLHMAYPDLPPEQRARLDDCRKMLMNE